jgi:glycosyltransferase involved in cell wall biosynthesis
VRTIAIERTDRSGDFESSSARPKVLSIFNEYLQPGGEALGVAQICEALRDIVDLQECRFSSAAWTGKHAPGVLRQAWWMIRNPASLSELREVQSKFCADAWLVHNVFPVGSASIYREAERLGVPVIQYLHNFRPFSVNGYLWAGGKIAAGGLKKNFFEEIRYGAWQGSRIKTLWFALVLRLMHAGNWFKSVRAWVAISEFVRTKMIEAGLPAGAMFTSLPYPWRRRNTTLGAPGEEKHYLFLGRLIDAKGIKVLLQAWKILEERLDGRGPRLVIAGSGPMEDFVRSESAKLKTVEFVGQISGDAKNQALMSAKAVVAPSLWWEALGLIAYEAYDYGKPILAAKSGGLQETVFHRRTGLLHEPGDPEQLAQQVIEMEENVELRHEMGREGRRWLEENTSLQDWQRKFSEILGHVL